MKSELLQQHLLEVYEEAVRLREWTIAEHLLCAIEACASVDAPICGVVARAYGVLAAEVQTPHCCAKRTKCHQNSTVSPSRGV